MSCTVLFVCTGNVCRSPMGERLLSARADPLAGITVGSAGVYALEGNPMDENSALALAELGGDPAGHHARWLTDRMVQDADLILTAESSHRDTVLRTAPGKMRRAFTMREFARLARSVASELDADAGADQRLLAVAGRRGAVDPPQPGEDDLPDPFRGPIEAARACAAEVGDIVDLALFVLGAQRRAVDRAEPTRTGPSTNG